MRTGGAETANLVAEYAHRHRVKPGITGWAQLCYPYGASVDDATISGAHACARAGSGAGGAPRVAPPRASAADALPLFSTPRAPVVRVVVEVAQGADAVPTARAVEVPAW